MSSTTKSTGAKSTEGAARSPAGHRRWTAPAPSSRQRRLLAGAALLLAALVLAACGVPTAGTSQKRTTTTTARSTTTTSTTTTTTTAPTTTTTAPTTTTTAASDSVTAVLPVVSCHTVFGVPRGPAPNPLPTSVKLTVPAALATQLAVYTDTHGMMKLVAPKGWTCSAQYGADGSGGVAVYPQGQTVPQGAFSGGWQLPASSPVQAMVGSQTSACVECTLRQACPLFPAAGTAYQQKMNRPCPTTRPPQEGVHRISSGIVGFQDPAGVVGSGIPSGGQNPANGVMTYHPSDMNAGSWLDTCTLPSAQHQLCTVALNAFVAAYGSL